tara:strand:- start:19699 stop:20055 length:357 start_codon:yes stop_codon:yes gene_type:complete
MGKRGSRRKSGSSKTIPTFPNDDLTTAGARRAVWEGRAQKTRGGLTRGDLKVSKSTGKIVSIRASRASKRSFERNGLRPDKNIANRRTNYRGSQNQSYNEEDVVDAERMNWESLLNDA